MANADFITTNAVEPTSALWRIVLTEYRQTEAEYQHVSAKHDEAASAFHREVGEENPDFERYNLRRFDLRDETREGRIFKVQTAIAASDYAGRHLDESDFAEIASTAAIIVDEYDAFSAKRDDAFARTIGLIEKDWEAQLDKLNDARNKLYMTPAPDGAAVALKLSILSVEIEMACADDRDAIAAISADAGRLFGEV